MSTNSIYLAISCGSEHRTLATKIARTLSVINEENFVYCPWTLKIPNAWDMSQEQWARKVFEADIKAINEADVVLCVTFGREKTSAGTMWENGYAYGINKPVWVIQIGEESTSLMNYCGCTHFINCATIDDLPEILVFFDNNWKIWNGVGCETTARCKTILT